MSFSYDSNGNLVQVDDSMNMQPGSYYSNPVSPQSSSVTDGIFGQRVGDILQYGLMRAIDVASINALQPTNTMVVTQPLGTMYGYNGPVARAGIGGGTLLLLAVGALFLFAEHKG
ncbi:hypothetical protein [Pandoraea norimbergensis]|uniref:Uncharacterized protein n=1 Tax=Pandoraea norimbergensis TaxID=93219 RepID=A0ABM5WMX1_9BURK|nr:hypothetical protein [Pandoraea norimbergensis]ALS61855.1 hypothetical protein AT302_20810 [Pandoraea norimbergensis]